MAITDADRVIFMDDLLREMFFRHEENPADIVETVTVSDTLGRPTTLHVPANVDYPLLPELAAFAHEQLPHYPKPDVLPGMRIFSNKTALQRHIPMATAAFMHGTREIWANNETLSDSPLYGHSTIVHEYVHYLQAIADNWEVRKMFGSAEKMLAIELEAFNVQWDYLNAHGFAFDTSPGVAFTNTMPADKAKIPDLIARYYTPYATMMARDTLANWKEGQ